MQYLSKVSEQLVCPDKAYIISDVKWPSAKITLSKRVFLNG